MKKVTRLKQPEGGVDIFKKKPIPKKPTQPEGSGMVKKKKLIQRQPEGSGAPKKPIQRQPEGSGAPKKITGRGEFRDTDTNKKRRVTNNKKTNVIKPAAPTSFAQAFSQARKKLGAGKTFTYKGKKYSTNRADDKKKTKTVTNVVKPKLRPKTVVKKKTNGSKKVASLKSSRMGIDGPAITVKKKTNGKTGLGSKVMATKTKKTFKGTNITPTAAQRKRMRSRMMGST